MTDQTAITIATGDDRTLRLHPHTIGSGTYGRVYPLADDPNTAAKVYRRQSASQSPQQHSRQAGKLALMAALPPPTMPSGVILAWPSQTFTITDQPDQEADHAGHGYLMSRAPKGAIKLADLIRKQNDPRRAHRAAQLLRQAARAIHEHDLVIGDINANNFALSPDDADLWIFDIDGWQIRAPDGYLHYAQGSTDHYTPREIMERISGTQLNCCNIQCPLSGRTHRPTPTCQPRAPRHDRHGIDILIHDLTRTTTRR